MSARVRRLPALWVLLLPLSFALGAGDLGATGPAAGPLSGSPAWIAEGDQDDAWFGVSVGTAGDVNGDGYADVIVGSYLYDHGEVDEGRAFVYHGSATGLSTSPAWSAESDQANAWFGYAVGTAGDVNGDGFSDVIVGAWHFANGESDEGRAYVYYGSAQGLASSPAWTAEGDQIGAHFAISVASAGDVNGDGFSDVIVGAWHSSSHLRGYRGRRERRRLRRCRRGRVRL
jgi:hypothetical protein